MHNMQIVLGVAALFVSSALAAPLRSLPIRAADIPDAATIRALAPQLGATPPLKPTGFGDCKGPVLGDNGKLAAVPCSCPPTFDDYVTAMIANVQGGFAVNNSRVAVTFPVGDKDEDKHGRITAAVITLQNLVGPGKGCPLVSTTLGEQSKAIDAGAADPSAGAAAPASAPPPAGSCAPPSTVTVTVTAGAAGTASPTPASVPALPSGKSPEGLTANQIIALAPSLGVTAGSLQPTGHGDCFGPIKGADGKPIAVPCTCPPTDDVYHLALVQNIFAGHAVNNTGVAFTSYPGSNSDADREARIEAAVVTLQNLNGPGKGCPIVSTTLGVQRQAISG